MNDYAPFNISKSVRALGLLELSSAPEEKLEYIYLLVLVHSGGVGSR